MTKIDIFSGFLGAGKTTLIKKLIKEAYSSEKVVLIENEFGEIGIDGGFLQDAGIEITEMNSGCICCSLVGDFTEALGKVLSEYNPDRIIIEPSGVGKLSDVISAASKVTGENATLNAFTTVVDAGKCKMYMKNFGEFFGDQIENASAIIFSHTDVVKEEKIVEAVKLVREHNATATVITTPWQELDGASILSAMENKDTLADAIKNLVEEHEHHQHEHGEDCKCGCHEHHHDHEEHEHHHHEHGEDCKCGCHGHHHEHEEHEHHHHEHGEDCKCGCHGHHHEHEEHEHHHHEHGEDCKCGCHGHHHEHEEHEHHHHEHGEDCKCGCHEHHHHHADEVFTSFGVETAKKFTKEEISNILEAFVDGDDYGMVLRAKGIVASDSGEWIHFDYVPGEPDVRVGTAGIIGRLCVIGAGIDKEKIKELFGV